jgi:nucleoside-diphosphate-sugar epimerase
MLDGLMTMMASEEVGPINLGNPNTECTINTLVKTFEKLFGFRIITTNWKKTENDPMVRRPDISAARNLLSFRPRVGLEEGLHKTMQYFISLYPPETMDL